jgi:DNA mismatch repair protein MutL
VTSSTTAADKLAKRFIRPLPKNVINKIAAGEVVERPASVVKELVENSLDAGADKIIIAVEQSGAKLIRIVDNGCGIGEDQIEIAFSRHATSKIAAFSDLNELSSYGFRGEALPAIASVSRLRMVSRLHDAQSGTEILIEGGVLQSKKPVSAMPGTTIDVENLFFNTPARRKFLRTESTEGRFISRLATALAFGRCDVGFTYLVNNKQVFALPLNQSLESRARELLGHKKGFVTVAGEQGTLKLTGYVGAPDAAQGNRNGQYIFINNRFIQSPLLSHALAAAYGELLVRGTFPVGVLLLTIDPAEVDANVHPSKTEVRLAQERDIHDAVYRIVKSALRTDTIVPILTPARMELPIGEQRENLPRPDSSSGVREYRSLTMKSHSPGESRQLVAELMAPPKAPSELILVDRSTGEIVNDNGSENSNPATNASDALSRVLFVGRFADLYLIMQAEGDLYLVDQHTAHERVLFEEVLRSLDRQGGTSQQLLFPVQLELSPELIGVFHEATALLNQSGFQVSHFGGRMVNIEAIPLIMVKKSPERLFTRMLDDIQSLKKNGYDLKKAVAQTVACRSAVMRGDRLNEAEAVHLVERLLKCETRYCCPHGRPTFVRITRADLDKQFGRA